MQHYMCTRFVFRPSFDKNPARPGTLLCYITVDKQRKKFTTPVRCLAKEWEAGQQRVKGTSKKARLDNAVLSDIEADINRLYYDMERAKEHITAARLLKLYQAGGKPKVTLLIAWEQFMQQRAPQVGVTISQAAHDAKEVRGRRLAEFLAQAKATDLLPDEFTAKWADRFLTWMRVEQGNSQNYTNKVLQSVKQVLRWCVRQELAGKNPLDAYSLKFAAPPTPLFLTPLELSRLWAYPYASEALRRIADLFLFQCYTGLAYVDLKRFDAAQDVQTGVDGRPWLVMQRQKTQHSSGRSATARLLKPALTILERYGNQLPVPSNQAYNRFLKEIAALVGIEGKKITTHVGRKTAGMLLLKDGMSLTAVSKVLGHTSVTMTEKHYVSITDDVVSKEYERIYGEAG